MNTKKSRKIQEDEFKRRALELPEVKALAHAVERCTAVMEGGFNRNELLKALAQYWEAVKK